MLFHRNAASIALPVFILIGCASDYAPRNNASVSPETYRADLDSCQSSAATRQAAHGAEGFLVGALWGAANGAAASANHGGADIGAAIGACVGAVVGFVEGLAWSDRTSISSCMRARSYRRV